MGILIAIVAFLVSSYILLKTVWKAGFLAGVRHEAIMWLASIDKLFAPNWQSLEIGRDEGLTPEQLEMANRVYAAAYRTAIEHIKLDIANIRRAAIEKYQAEQQEDAV
jgi:hypothetical protein